MAAEVVGTCLIGNPRRVLRQQKGRQGRAPSLGKSLDRAPYPIVYTVSRYRAVSVRQVFVARARQSIPSSM